MRASLDTLDTVEPVQKKKSNRALATVAPHKEVFTRGLLHAPRERWCSSLDPQSLRCLLAILEEKVIPQLVGGYSPAAAAPLPPRDTSG